VTAGKAAKASPSTTRERLKRTEKELAALHRKHLILEQELDAVGGDHVALARIGTALATVQADIERAENQWLELSVERP